MVSRIAAKYPGNSFFADLPRGRQRPRRLQRHHHVQRIVRKIRCDRERIRPAKRIKNRAPRERRIAQLVA